MDLQLPPPAPTTIFDLGDDLLRQISSASPPSRPSSAPLAAPSAAPSARPLWTPAFRRSFRERHAPPVLALFLEPDMEVVPLHPCPWRRRDPGVAADFFDVSHTDAHPSRWKIKSWQPSADGYLILDNWSGRTKRTAAYSPLTQALDLFLNLPPAWSRCIHLEFYMLPSQDGREPARVVCVFQGSGRPERPAVFSLDTMEWQIFPETMLWLGESDMPKTGCGMVVHRLVCLTGRMYDQIVVLDTATFQFSLIDLPMPLQPELGEAKYKLGVTKDEKLCIIDIKNKTIVSWFLDNGSVVERWIAYRNFPLPPIVRRLTGCSMEKEGCRVKVDLVAVVDGFVYLCIFYPKDTEEYLELYLSLCLERLDIWVLFKGAYRRAQMRKIYFEF
ncbi:hypothetical protein VPH35_004988 [Triticum aestivum]